MLDPRRARCRPVGDGRARSAPTTPGRPRGRGRRAIRQGHEAAARYPGRVLEVRYEDLVSKPAETVGAICDFVGLDYSDDMLAIEQTDRSKVVEDQSAWFTNVWSGITTAAVGKWRTELTPRQIEVFETVAGDELRALGYETSGGAASRGARSRVRRARRRHARRELRPAAARAGARPGGAARAQAKARPMRLVKRVADPVLALVALVVLSPVFLAISLWIVVESGRPIFFVYPRAGKDGRSFRMVKFRTMVQDAIELGRSTGITPRSVRRREGRSAHHRSRPLAAADEPRRAAAARERPPRPDEPRRAPRRPRRAGGALHGRGGAAPHRAAGHHRLGAGARAGQRDLAGALPHGSLVHRQLVALARREDRLQDVRRAVPRRARADRGRAQHRARAGRRDDR